MGQNLWCMEKSVHVIPLKNGDKSRVGLGTSEPYETAFETTGDLYRACVRQFGRCIGGYYRQWGLGQVEKVCGAHHAAARKIGWVFLKAAMTEGLEGCVETWVTVYTKPPKRIIRWEGAEYPTFK